MKLPPRLSQKDIEEILNTIKGPVCIADGEEFGNFEKNVSKFLQYNNIQHDSLENLYIKQQDLTKYKTICFSSTFTYPEQVNKLIKFDLSNLETLIIDPLSYEKLESQISKLKPTLNIIFCSYNLEFIDNDMYKYEFCLKK